MKQIKNYLETFKPINFSAKVRLVLSVLFTIFMAVYFYIHYNMFTELNNIQVLNNDMMLIPLSFILSLLLYLSIDNTCGFGRNYVERAGWVNFTIIYALWAIFIIFNLSFIY